MEQSISQIPEFVAQFGEDPSEQRECHPREHYDQSTDEGDPRPRFRQIRRPARVRDVSRGDKAVDLGRKDNGHDS